jgi:predicted signal transduction protein with EAL and GGDEF domain
MISTFIKASHDLGIITLAEGIECAEEAQVCQQLGFDLAQGYFFGRPLPISEIEGDDANCPDTRSENPAPSPKTDRDAEKVERESPMDT